MTENNEAEEFEEQEDLENLDVAKERKIKRVNLDEEDSLTETIFAIPKSDLKKLSHESTEKEISKGAIVRKLIKEHLLKEEKPAQPNPEAIISDEKLEELLNFCTTYQGGFQTTGDNGFFMQFAAREWKFSDLTDSQFLAVCNYLKTGYDGFFSPPSIEEFIGWIEEIEPSKEQVELAKLILLYNVEFTDEDAEKTVKELFAEIKAQVGTEESEPLESLENWKTPRTE